MIDEKYIEMFKLAVQIEVLQELPCKTVYKADAQLNNLKQKSAVMMNDLVDIINEKRRQLAKLDGVSEIGKLKKENGALLAYIKNQFEL